MANNAELEDLQVQEKAPLVSQSQSRWTKRDILVLVAMSSANFAEAVELYLPGVITQAVGCRLKLSKMAEGFLGITLYVFLALSVCASGAIVRKLGLRRTIYLSQYLSAASIVFCSVFPDYYTLVLSRALIGLSAGQNYCLIGLYLARNMSAETWVTGSFVINVAYAAGSMWAPFIGFLALERLGWRLFIITASLPMLVLPTVLLQCVITEDNDHEYERVPQENSGETVEKPSLISSIFQPKILKKSILDFTTLSIGYGSVLLFPALIRATNQGGQDDSDPCHGVVTGTQFLFLSLAGVGNMLGRVLGYRLMKYIGFRSHMVFLAASQCLCYLSVLLWNDIIVVVVAMSLSKVFYSMSRMELNQMASTEAYFGKENHLTANTITQSIGLVGSIVGAVNAAFVPSHFAAVAPLAIGVVICLVSMLTTDYVR